MFAKMMIDLTQATTCHGIRFIWMKDSFWFRRGFWLLAFLAAVCILVVQVVDRITYFYSNPYNVKVEVNFNHSMKFPVIAICNQNEFKITEAVKNDRRALINDLYGQKLNLSRLLDTCRKCDRTAHPNGCPCELDLTLDNLYFELAHRKEDMIVSCKWNRMSCSPDDFEITLTDHGICFEFNGAEDDSKARLASGAGTEHGLQLVLNIEQYEYMLGEHDSAGLKILLYSNREVPMVTYLGQGVAPGTRTFVGTTVTVMDRLPKPHGNCTKQEELQYYSKYTEMACKKDCQAVDFIARCGCRQSSLWRSDTIPICTIKQTLECYEKHSEHFQMPSIGISTEHAAANCSKCESPCNSVFYQPNFSYLKTSNFDVDRNLAELDHATLLARYTKARDTVSATDKRTLTKDFKLLNTLIDAAAQVEHFLTAEDSGTFWGNDLISKTRMFGFQGYRNVANMAGGLGRYTEKIAGYFRERRELVEQLFARGVQIVKEHTLDEVSLNIARYAEDVRADIVALANFTNSNDPALRETVRKRWYEHASNLVASKQNAVKRSREEIKRIIHAYETGFPLVPYADTVNKTRLGLIPTNLLKEAVSSEKAKQNFKDMEASLSYITDTLNALDVAVSTAYGSYQYEPKKINISLDSLTAAVTEFHAFQVSAVQDVFYKVADSATRTERIYQDKIRTFDATGVREDLSEPGDIIINSAKEQKSEYSSFNASLSIIRGYLEHQTPGKTDIAKHFTSQGMTIKIADFNTYFKTIKLQFRSLIARYLKYYNIFKKSVLAPAIEDLADLNKAQIDEAFYNYLGIPCTDLLNDTSPSCTQFDNRYNALRFDIDRYLNETIGSKDTMFLDSLYKVTKGFTGYLDNGNIDAAFYTDNFLSLDIFFREMSYELIEQQPAYDQFALISDIGGSMGLFVGASVLTLCELLDAVTLYIYKRFIKRDSVSDHKHSKYSTKNGLAG
ncbi:uncharacterized protein LOC135501729 isoform X2 [Lineus longissimus]|uniref:uncharacterized protein LOC135501729 isoform X2 n=1 Tax=Lineus longissimus TaxID=88925 RepID=UPI002B4CDE18